MGGLLLLNLGCGPHYADGWVNVDRYGPGDVADGRRVDVIGDIMVLPYGDGSCSRVYMGHVLEHLDLREAVPRVLREVRRVLVRGGELMVVVPDVERAREGWPGMVGAILPKADDHLLAVGLPHLWAPTETATLESCKQVFPGAVALPIASVSASWPVVDRVGWQSAVYCPNVPR